MQIESVGAQAVFFPGFPFSILRSHFARFDFALTAQTLFLSRLPPGRGLPRFPGDHGGGGDPAGEFAAGRMPAACSAGPWPPATPWRAMTRLMAARAVPGLRRRRFHLQPAANDSAGTGRAASGPPRPNGFGLPLPGRRLRGRQVRNAGGAPVGGHAPGGRHHLAQGPGNLFQPRLSPGRPVPGVPAYHLLLSDQALDIDADKGTVSGASIIWQAITTQTSIAYGTPDPSGNFSKMPAPPLSPNVPYNLVVLNNYDGRSALATSAKAQGLKLFPIAGPGPRPQAPRNLVPAAGPILTVSADSDMTFRWTALAVRAGAGQHLPALHLLPGDRGRPGGARPHLAYRGDRHLRRPGRQADPAHQALYLEGLRPGPTGAGVVGDTTSFQYRNDVQTLSIAVRSPTATPRWATCASTSRP